MPSSLPNGTVTFLFTDIEGSTNLAQQYPDQWEKLRDRHNLLLHQSIQAHNGYVFQIIGDAFCVAFHTASDALNAAVAAQRLLQQEAWDPVPIQVRMGINTGSAQANNDDAGGYIGYTTLARVQRVMSVAYGEQILLTNTCYELIRDELPAGISLHDLKEHRLKGLLNPEHLWQVAAPDLRLDFPPLQSSNSIPNNLPVQLTTFIGREKEIADIKKELNLHWLVTLTGPGGAGKTRLALQVGADMLDEFKNGVWFVELAPLSDERLVPQAVSFVLGIQEEAGRLVVETLVDYIKDKELLIILDNCEHLVHACAELAKQLSQSGPSLRILATSREPLLIGGELTYPVPSLSMPDPRKKITIEAFMQYEAVQLFINRAMEVKPAFRVTSQNASAVADICHGLDGIPLAIELAAARVRALPVEKIAQRLSDRFRLLTGGDRTAEQRQQTLRATIDWSYDLISEPERAIFRRLAVFAKSWTLEAAEAVCAGAEVNEMEVLDLLTHLVEKSLVTLEAEGERYVMLETVRQYAREKLEMSGEADSYRLAHGEYFLKLAEQAEPHLTGAQQVKWLHRLELEHDNLRAALEWLLGAGKGEDALRLCGALGRYWGVHGHLTEGRDWLRQALAVGAGATHGSHQAKVLRWAGVLAYTQGDYEAAKRLSSESVECYRELGDKRGLAYALNDLGNISHDQGDYAGARGLWEQSLALFRELGKKRGMSVALNNLGLVAYTQGDHAAARSLYEESLVICRELGDKSGLAYALVNLGHVSHAQGDHVDARRLYEESLSIFRELEDRSNMAYALSGIANVLWAEGQAARAARLQGVVVALLEEIGALMEQPDKADYDKTAGALKAALGEEDYRKAFEAGKEITFEKAIELSTRKK